MSAPLSVIIPTLNVADKIGPCLMALSEALSSGLLAEVIFADGGSNDGTAEIAENVGANFVKSKPGRGVQMRAGAAVARGDWFLFLHADSVLSDDWQRCVTAHLTSRNQAGFFKLRFDETSIAARIVAGSANFRSRFLKLPYGDQGLLIHRQLYNNVGGYQPIPLMEDVAMARVLRGKLRPLDATVVTSADKYRRDGWVRRVLKNAILITKFRLGADPEKLARQYR